MHVEPRPCFEQLAEFKMLDSMVLSLELSVVLDYLAGFSAEVDAFGGYKHVKAFLQEHSTTTRYGGYRAAVERLFLWSLIEAQKPITTLDDSDLRAFFDFCLQPPADWVSGKPEKRYIKPDSRKRRTRADTRFNPSWKPFCASLKKHPMLGEEASSHPHITGDGVLAVMLSVVYAFFDHLISTGTVIIANPAYQLYRSKPYSASSAIYNGARMFSVDEWDAVMETLYDLVKVKPDLERALMLFAAVYYLQLQPGEIDRFGENLRVNCLVRLPEGHYDVLLQEGSDQPRYLNLRIDPVFVEHYVDRYRHYLGRECIPYEEDDTCLLGKLKGKGAVTSRHANLLFKQTCQQIVEALERKGTLVSPESALRVSSIVWIRETSIFRDVARLPMSDLFRQIRNHTSQTIYDKYIAWHIKPSPRGAR